MDLKKVEKGIAVMWFNGSGRLFKGFFWGVTDHYDSTDSFFDKFVVVLDKKYLEASDMKGLSNQYGLPIDDQEIVFGRDVNSLSIATDRKYARAVRRVKFVNKHKANYVKWYNSQLIQSLDAMQLTDTPIFDALTSFAPTLRLRYFAAYVWSIPRRVFKFVVLPVLFVVDSIRVSFGIYKKYRADQRSYQNAAHNEHRYAYLNLALGREDYKKEIDKLKSDAESSQKDFVESGKFIVTILISAITLAGTLIWARIDHLIDANNIAKLNSDLKARELTISNDEKTFTDLRMDNAKKDFEISVLRDKIEEMKRSSK